MLSGRNLLFIGCNFLLHSGDLVYQVSTSRNAFTAKLHGTRTNSYVVWVCVVGAAMSSKLRRYLDVQRFNFNASNIA